MPRRTAVLLLLACAPACLLASAWIRAIRTSLWPGAAACMGNAVDWLASASLVAGRDCCKASGADRFAPGQLCHGLALPLLSQNGTNGLFIYGGLAAIQTLWITPWLICVKGWTALQAAQRLFWRKVAMLFTFWGWGLVNPKGNRRG